MERIDENAAAEDYEKKLRSGYYPLERSKNDGVDYCKEKEKRDTDAIREFMQSSLFQEFKSMQ